MDTKILSLAIFLLAVLSICIYTYTYMKKQKNQSSGNSNENIFELLKDFAPLIITITNNTLRLLNISDFENEKDYRDAIADIVADEFIEELRNSGEFDTLLKIIDRSDVKLCILKLFTIYKKEIKISELFTSHEMSKNNKLDINEPAKLQDEGLVDITSHLDIERIEK